jgi:transposase-like protein
MEGQNKKSGRGPNLPRMVREQIIHEYLSGRKTSTMLGKEHGICYKSVQKMVSRYKQQNSVNFADNFIQPIMPRKVKQTDHSALQAENEQLKRQLQLAQLKIEGYQIMGDTRTSYVVQVFWRRSMASIC